MMIQLISALDWLLWLWMAVSVAYVAFFALASLLPARRRRPSPVPSPQSRFLVIVPAYAEDGVIRHTVASFLQQDYPHDSYLLAVVSDHMQPATNEWIASQPVALFQPAFEQSSKAKALQYAMEHVEREAQHDGFEHVVILDADNVVSPDFLTRLNALCSQGYQAIQCHRTAKNADTDIAALDGLSEEINNTLFRRAHNLVGLSSALIGSGMCFGYDWFRQNVSELSTAGEDRELEALLLQQRIHIHYADDIRVMDEKVSSSDNFQRQRLRWMSAQVHSLLSMLPHLPHALFKGNIDYADKTLQQALIPRSILLLLISILALATTVVAYAIHPYPSPLKWWILLGILCLSILIAIPAPLRTKGLLRKALSIPQLAWRMLCNLLHIDTHNNVFIHTTHDK